MTYRIFKNRLKKAHKSFTVWFNSVGAILLTALLIEPAFVEYLSAHELSYVLTIGNLMLRFKTKSDMADK